jgi:hydrogenase maturation protein HypF
MDEFPLCPDCQIEYANPSDRRFHAQTTCCWNCGPHYYLLDRSGNIIISKEDFKQKWHEIVKLLNEEAIIAIKGIGGTHIACGTLSDDPILKIRRWKGARGDKPFAVMTYDINHVRSFARCNSQEAQYLQSIARPIILLAKSHNYSLSSYVSPGLHNIGVLLPYAGIHYLLTEKINDPALIMTSGNPSNLPILIENTMIQDQLSSVAEYFLLHDRKIHQRADDSVLRLHMINGEEYPLLIRRSRGYIPEPIELPWSSGNPNILSLGAEMYTVGALGVGSRCFPTQHIGHITTVENKDYLMSSIEHMKALMGIKTWEAIGCDLHPQFMTTMMGQELTLDLEIPLYQFQHHFAHLSALALDAQIDPEEEIICVALDGTGYGEDGFIWGGEILLGNYHGYKRIAHLENQVLLGGDQAISQPYRFLLAVLLKQISFEEIDNTLKKLPWLSWITKNAHYPIIGRQIEKITTSSNPSSFTGYNLTSSCGRVLDAISVLLGSAKHRTYEGEPAIKLEALAEKAKDKTIDINLEFSSKLKNTGIIEIQTSDFIYSIWKELMNGENRAKLALAAEIALIKEISRVAFDLAEKYGVSKIGLSGGVAYNQIIFTEFYRNVSDHSYNPIKHRKIPCGDGGISIGQIPLVLTKIRNGSI